jgi:SAM-dependent methyltransferase
MTPPANASAQEWLNSRVYHDPHVSRWYRSDTLDYAETIALLRHQPAFAGREVLDIGVGTGRTTRYVAPLASRYVGIDMSVPMIEHVRANLPGVEVLLADMRNLAVLADQSFDFVLGSCNVLDAVSHEDRMRVFAEVGRVIRPGGTFMFSSHNRRLRTALSGPTLARSHNPATQIVLVWRYLRSLRNHARFKRLRRLEPNYALLNDSGHDFAALHYYVDRDTQRQQLERSGFVLQEVLDSRGRRLEGTDDDSDSSSLLYVAERIA